MVPCMLVLCITFLLSSEFPTSDVYNDHFEDECDASDDDDDFTITQEHL